jgi:hypothetical protein
MMDSFNLLHSLISSRWMMKLVELQNSFSTPCSAADAECPQRQVMASA